jgi:hypothetical protein
VAQWIENAWSKITMPKIMNSWTKLMDIGSSSINIAEPIPSEVDYSIDSKCNNNDPLQTPVDIDEADTHVNRSK